MRKGSRPALLLFLALPARGFALDCPPDARTVSLESYRSAAIERVVGGAITEVRDSIRSCFPVAPPACLRRVESFIRTRSTAPASSDTHASRDERKQPPAELVARRLDGGGVVLADDVERIAREKNWPAVRYKSRHAGGFDRDTSSLLMVRVPGESLNPPVNYDRYLNFAIAADDEAEAMNPIPQKPLAVGETELSRPGHYPSQFTIVTVTRPTGPERSEVSFQKYGRTGTRWVPDAPASAASCYQCHPNGLRAISPLGYHVRKLADGTTERQMPEAEWRKVREMNQAMERSSNGKLPDWRGARVGDEFRSFLDVEGYGPVIGPTTPLASVGVPQRTSPHALNLPLTRQKEFILGGTIDGVTYPGCYQARPTVSVRDIFGRQPGRDNVYRLTREPAIRWQVVRDAMNCASCHGNLVRGGLNQNTDFAQVDFKILVDQSMPDGHHQNPLDRGSPNAPVQDRLNPNERIALANCLKTEFESYERAKTREWLAEAPCAGADGMMPAPGEWWKVR